MGKNKLINAIIIATVFFFIYSVKFTFLPTYISRIILFISFIYFILNLFTGNVKPNPRGYKKILLWIGLYLGWIAIINIISDNIDTGFIFHNIVFVGQATIGSLCLGFWLSKNKYSPSDIALSIQIAIVLQAIFIILGFISPSFREWTLTYIPVMYSNIDPTVTLYRSRGLTHSSGAGLAFIQAIGLLISCYLFIESKFTNKNNRYMNWYFPLSCSLISASILLTGRTGALVVPICLFYLLVSDVLTGLNVKRILSYMLLLFLLILAFYILRLGYNYILGGWTTAWGEDGFDQLIRWWTSEFYQDNEIGSTTATTLLDVHWHLPHDWMTLLIGEVSTWDLYRGQIFAASDIGVIRRIYATGIVGTFIFYSLILNLFKYAYTSASNDNTKKMFIFLFLWLFIGELKEPFITSADIASVYMLLSLSSLFYTSQKSSSLKKNVKDKNMRLHSPSQQALNRKL